MVEKVLDLIAKTAIAINEAHQAGTINVSTCIEKRLYLESIRVIVLEVDLDVEGQFEVLELAVDAIRKIKTY